MKTVGRGRHLPWLLCVISAGLVTRVPRILAQLTMSTRTALTYHPVLASERFETCARALISRTPGPDAFSYASPMYIFFLAPFYALSLSNFHVFLVQTVMGVLSAAVIYLTAFRAGASRVLSLTGALFWLFYAPAAFFEMTLLPVSLLALLVSVWAFLELRGSQTSRISVLSGFVLGVISGLRPPFLLMGVFSIGRILRGGRRTAAVFFCAGALVPLLALAIYHRSQGGGFSPFPPSTGLNLVLGHADGATGFGPPIPEYGLVESPGEDIHQAGARVAALHGHHTPVRADRFWMKTALVWIFSNPGDEFRLIGAKLGGWLGHRPYDVYHDMERDVGDDGSLRHLVLPRYLLVAFLALGALPALLLRRKGAILAVPLLVSLAVSLAFVHSERYWLPGVPAGIALASSGYGTVLTLLRTPAKRKRTVAALAGSALLMLPGLIWPVRSTPEGLYLYNRAVRAYNMGNPVLSLTLFEAAAEESPPGTHTSVYARYMAINLSRAMNLEERAARHSAELERELRD